MSTFNGLIDEISYISVDRFEKHNLNSSLFFLSHCHSDHMTGLDKEVVLPGKLYCSEISSIYLKKKIPNLSTNIEILELEVPVVLFNPTNYFEKFVVTSIPSLHCPGSVMFVFETEKVKILYTGDFRHSIDTLKKYPILNSKFDKIFIDSTFLSKDYYDFPSQDTSLIVLSELTKNWISKGKEYKVIIETTAQCGFENILTHLCKNFQILIYIENTNIEKFSYFPEIDKCLVKDIYLSSVAFVAKNYSNNFKLKWKEFKFRILKPTAIFWRMWSYEKPIYKHERDEIYRIALSNHSSLKEITDILCITKPKEVKLNVTPNNYTEKRKMEDILQYILKDSNIQSCEDDKNNHYNFKKIENNLSLKHELPSTKFPLKKIKF